MMFSNLQRALKTPSSIELSSARLQPFCVPSPPFPGLSPNGI